MENETISRQGVDDTLIKFYHVNSDGERVDISSICSAFNLGGELMQVSRKLDVNIMRPAIDYYLQSAKIERGDNIIIVADDKIAYVGVVWFVSVDENTPYQSVTCYDMLFYLNKSESASSVFSGMTAEEVTEKVCGELGVDVGNLAKTDVSVQLNGRGQSGYHIIMSAYTEAMKVTSKKYYPLISDGYFLDVIEKGDAIPDFEISYKNEPIPGSIISVQYTDSGEDMVNQIITLDDSGGVVSTRTNEDDLAKYGLVQKIAQTSDSESGDTGLSSGKLEVEIECIGDWRLKTGYSVKVKTQQIDAVLYIEADTHEMREGNHYCTLRLSYKNEMDEQEMKEEIQEVGSDIIGGTSSGENLSYVDVADRNQFASVLSRAGQFAGKGDYIISAAKTNNINPTMLAAIMLFETGRGSVLNYNNPGGIMDWENNWATLRRFSTLEEGISFTASTVKNLVGQSNGTLQGLGAIYAPVGAGNDPGGTNGLWPSSVESIINEMGGWGIIQSSSGTSGGSSLGNLLVQTAKKYLGIPYVWGGTTPSGFDCSGLMQYVYRECGISISRVTYTQEYEGVDVTGQNLQPGDLVFWGARGNTYHVGMYIGNGQYIQAPQTGDVVKISTLGSYSVARRII